MKFLCPHCKMENSVFCIRENVTVISKVTGFTRDEDGDYITNNTPDKWEGGKEPQYVCGGCRETITYFPNDLVQYEVFPEWPVH
jgi:phage FluMu protein Com